ncbi:MAG TPA: type VI secretion system protein TssA [Bryobacteraceae bacterium]|jgi:type VI secretion system ImpA family protein
MTPAPARIFQFDAEKLLAPIEGEQPTGADLRYDALYDLLRELRREDDASLPQGVWQSDQKRADWRAVESACLEALETRSKDLQIAAWLTEAWVHLNGFEGAGEGFRLMAALCTTFWDDLYPKIEGDDAEFRIAPLIWLNRKLPTDLKLLPLTNPEGEGIPICALADWEMAAPTAGAQSRSSSQTPTAARAMTLARFQESARKTSTWQLGATADRIRGMLRECSALEGFLDEKLGRESPGLVGIRSVGDTALALLMSLLHERQDDSPPPKQQLSPSSETFPQVTDTSSPEADQEERTPSSSGGRIRSRAEAYRSLADAADFLARTEPHSPASYLVRRAIEWGSMSLQELLPELVRNPGELTEIFRLLNVRPPDAPKK